jgi:hypothetical protein
MRKPQTIVYRYFTWVLEAGRRIPWGPLGTPLALPWRPLDTLLASLLSPFAHTLYGRQNESKIPHS